MKNSNKNNSLLIIRKLLSQLVKIIKPEIEFRTFPGNYFRGTLINVIENRIFHMRNVDVVIVDSEEVLDHIQETMINVDKIESIKLLNYNFTQYLSKNNEDHQYLYPNRTANNTIPQTYNPIDKLYSDELNRRREDFENIEREMQKKYQRNNEKVFDSDKRNFYLEENQSYRNFNIFSRPDKYDADISPISPIYRDYHKAPNQFNCHEKPPSNSYAPVAKPRHLGCYGDSQTFSKFKAKNSVFAEIMESTLSFENDKTKMYQPDPNFKYDPIKFYDCLTMDPQNDNRIIRPMKNNSQNNLKTGSIIRDFIKHKKHSFL